MNIARKIAACVAAWLMAAHPALAINDTIGVTAGAGKTANLIAFTGGNVISEVGICDATTANQCASVGAGGALTVTGAGGTFPVTGTVAATQSGTWNIGTVTAVTAITNALPAGGNIVGAVRILGNGGSNLDFAGQNAGAPNAQLIGGQFNTTPTAITTGNVSPLQLDGNGNLRVNIMAGGSGGGAVTMAAGAVASGAYVSGALVDGAIATLGTQADLAWTSGNGTAISILKSISTGVGSAIPTGANVIGKVGIDQTTPGTTNGISVASDAGTVTAGTTAITGTVSGTPASGLIGKASAGNLQSVYVTSSAAGWVFLVNSATVPGSSTLTVGTGSGNLQGCFELQKGVTDYQASINYNPGPWEHFSTGIAVALSTTACPVLTTSATGRLIHAQVN